MMVMLQLSSVLLPQSLLFLSVPHGRGCSSVVKGRGQSWESGLSPGRQCWPGDPGPLFPGHFHE